MLDLFARYGHEIALVVHTAAQPSHDWAAREPFVDFDINAVGTLNLLEATRLHAPEATFIFTSTNKVYGDRPNELPLVELETRWEIERDHTYWNGIREDMSIDSCLHSLFGASKVAADVLVQEYGRYFGLRTACFRGGTLTGPNHSAAELHGFLAYVMRCVMTGRAYNVFGYKGKQVRDAIHSEDLIRAFDEFFRAPRVAEVYNIGGGRFSNASVLEAIDALRRRSPARSSSGRTRRQTGSATTSGGSATTVASRAHYPDWQLEYDVPRILRGDPRRERGPLAASGRAGGRLAREASAVWSAATSRVCRSRRRARESGRSPRARRRGRAPAPRTASRSRRARRPRRNPL